MIALVIKVAPSCHNNIDKTNNCSNSSFHILNAKFLGEKKEKEEEKKGLLMKTRLNLLLTFSSTE